MLVVDDDEILRSALELLITAAGARVLTAPNGREAVEVIEKSKVDLVISDIQMPIMNGVELTKYLSGISGPPVILMTGFSDLLDAQEAFKVGAKEFFAKPVDRVELFEAMRKCLLTTEKPPDEVPAEYLKVSIDDFVSGREISFNIFVRISEHKFIKVAHKGEDLSIDRVKAYKAKGLHHVYLKADDFRKYVGFNLRLLPKVERSSLSQAKKLNLIKHTGEVLLEQIRHEGVEEGTYSSACDIVESTLRVLKDDDDIFEILSILKSHADHLYAHSVGVSVYSVMLAKTMGWALPSNLFKVGMAGLLHDVGKKEIPRAVLMVPRREWGPAEVAAYESHPQRGYESLRGLTNVPEDVLQVVKEHHESCTGTGFPARVRSSKIHPMAKLVSVADAFCTLTIAGPDGGGQMPHEAIIQLSGFHRERFDSRFFSALLQLFGKTS